MTKTTEKKTFKNMAAQGDLMIMRMKDGETLPEGLKKVKPEGGKIIVAHSETGHHHFFAAQDGVEYFTDPKDNMTCYLQVSREVADLIHDRSFDTHQPISVTKGTYKMRRQREYTPEGYRRVED